MTTVTSRSEDETIAVGHALGRQLRAGDAVLLTGPLGAGKTAFTRGVVEGLAGSPDQVSSPTFTIVQEYAARVRVEHVDLYRLSPAEVDDLALEDLWEGSVLIVEWPDRWARRPADAIAVEIAFAGETGRTIRIENGPLPPELP